MSEPAQLGGADPATALRVGYRRRLLHLAARDLTGAEGSGQVAAELADLAAAALEAALAIARSQLPPGSAPCRLAVIAMGKCGGRELNYASDIDVIFVAGPGAEQAGPGAETGQAGDGREAAALRTATRLAAGMIRVCSAAATEEALFPVDPNLRPEGRDGPLVRTLASHRAYYERWAKTWEFQALLKARPVAGDAELGQAYLAAIGPMVWQSAQREHFVADVQAMRRRVLGSLPADRAGREIKLGPGGLRDIEFAVQLLQLVHGRTDETLRAAATLDALAALARGGYVGREDAASLAAAYRFLRSVEHLLQLRQLRRTHMLPEDPAVLRQVGRALRAMRDAEPGHGDPADDLLAQWRRHASQARRLHEKLFYRPLLEAVARLPGEAARLTQEAARARLEALGYADPAGRAAAHRVPHLGRLAQGRHPAHAAAGDARLVRRRGPARRGPARLPAGQRGARGNVLVPEAAAGRHQGRAADGQAAGLEPVRHRAAAARPRRGGHAGRRRPARAQARRSAVPRRRGRRAQARHRRRGGRGGAGAAPQGTAAHGHGGPARACPASSRPARPSPRSPP